MSKITPITSSSHMSTMLSSNTYVVADFYADWCGPCKMIAPIFDQLASTHAAHGKMAFVKVNVDSQQDVARKYSVQAMPTFLILKNGSVVNTIRGADPSSLRTAVQRAATDASKSGGAPSAAFQTKGHTLGSASSSTQKSSGPLPASWTSAASSVGSSGNGFVDTVVRFVALYLTSLCSLEPERAAASSPFSIRAGRR